MQKEIDELRKKVKDIGIPDKNNFIWYRKDRIEINISDF